MRVLITGFEPFGKYKVNPSWEVAKTLNGLEIAGAEIVAEKLPVAFKKVIHLIPELLRNHDPSIIISLGLASGRPVITVERVAINVMDTEKPDNEGYKPEDEPIFQDGPAAYFATIPIKRIVKRLREEGIPAMISNSAGTYLCNTVMYTFLYYIDKMGMNARAGFIHLPFLPKQVVDKPQPSMAFEMMVKGVRIAIEESINAFKESAGR
ncbi:MAG: pyroglutamyl-peptidase I [Candidatus Njordarchaeales archaeon]